MFMVYMLVASFGRVFAITMYRQLMGGSGSILTPGNTSVHCLKSSLGLYTIYREPCSFVHILTQPQLSHSQQQVTFP